MTERENRDAVAILVKAPPAMAKAVRVNITLPEDEARANRQVRRRAWRDPVRLPSTCGETGDHAGRSAGGLR